MKGFFGMTNAVHLIRWTGGDKLDKWRVVDEKGEVRRFVNIYVGGEDIRFLQNQQTPLKSGDEVSIVPAIAGG
jgi:molybdopterin converting factor small subunit